MTSTTTSPRILASCVAAVAIVASGAVSAQAEPTPPGPSQEGLSDSYVLSPIVKTGGKTYTSADGVKVISGEIPLDRSGASSRVADAEAGGTTLMFGSSYAKNVERLQYWYDGSAYASGKRDYNPNGLGAKRVMQVCFKYTRDGVDVIGWQCSTARPGPAFSPGPVVKKTIRDTLNPVAPKTIFRYSTKVL